MTSRELEFSGTADADEFEEPVSNSDRIEGIRVLIAGCEDECIEQAEALVSRFRKERIALHSKAFEHKRSFRSYYAPGSRGSWCPLNLFSRFHNGSLQIYWQLVHRDRRTKAVGYKHLAKNKRGGYDLRSLLAHAHVFERDLVIEYEEEAERQRQRWLHLMKMKHYRQRMLQAHTTDTALARRLMEHPETGREPAHESTVWADWPTTEGAPAY